MASHSNPTVDINQDGEKFSIKLHSMFVTRESSFTVGDEYEETQHNGAVMKVRAVTSRRGNWFDFCRNHQKFLT